MICPRGTGVSLQLQCKLNLRLEREENMQFGPVVLKQTFFG